MGRNGKSAPVFPQMVKLVNENVGKIISSDAILLGNKPGRNSVTSYLYKFVKLGYIKPTAGFINDEFAQYEVLKPFPQGYNSVMMGDELKIVNGKIPYGFSRVAVNNIK